MIVFSKQQVAFHNTSVVTATVISTLASLFAKAMRIKMKLLLTVFFIWHVSAKPFVEANTCRVREKFDCGEEPCICSKDSISSWMNFLNRVLPAIAKKCACKKTCERISEVPCKKGVCDKISQKCQCFPCWSGVSCNIHKNPNNPMFATNFMKINLVNEMHETKIVGKVRAKDADKATCHPKLKCPCADIRYSLLEGGDDTFEVNSESGNIILYSSPYKDDYLLVIGASNLDEVANSSLLYVHVNTRRYDVNRKVIPHMRGRRAVSSGTLILTLQPKISTQFYYNIGEQIKYTITLSHNSSLSAITASNVIIHITSDYLQLTTDGLSSNKDGLTITENMSAVNTLTVTMSSDFVAGKKYEANITATVKQTIGPLSNLKLSAELNATGDIHLKATSSPVVFAVYPKVNLTRSESGAVANYHSTNFSMKIDLPKLNYSLLAELTTNIEDFIFMEIQNVRVANKGSNVFYNGTAVPQYHSTNKDGKNDRVVIDFGYIRNNADTGNSIEILFSVKVLDHVLLVNNTKHWIGVGLQAGMRVLWVEQLAFTILKEEPSLEVEVVPANFTNTTRLYLGDNLPVQYTVKHTNTSTAAASGIVITCIFENLEPVTADLTANKISTVNSTTVTVKPGGVSPSSLNLGNTLTGLFNLKLLSTVTPFIETKVKFVVTYKNAGNTDKDPVVKEMVPTVLAGTPSILMSMNTTSNFMKPGETRRFTVKVLLTKMRCPIRFELVMPLTSNHSVYHIAAVHDAVIGSNIIGLNTSAKPVLKSSMNDGINNQAIYDLGIAINTVANLSDSTTDMITLNFDVILLDHNNVTNNSEHWVGAGLVGKPKMIWVGQILIKALVPVDSRPWLYMKPSLIPGIPGSKQFPDYEYNVILKHIASSTQRANDVKIRFFLPNFVQFVSMVAGSHSRLTEKQFGGSRLFEISNQMNFVDNFNFTFKVSIDSSKFPRKGKIFITTPIYLLYKNRLGQQFSLVKALRKSLDVPITDTTPEIASAEEYYDKGISWNIISSGQYHVYVCSDAKAKRMLSACYVTEDKGATWKAVDSRVASITGHDSGNVFGIARNKRAYMKFDKTVKAWASISKSDFLSAPKSYRKLNTTTPSGNPATPYTVGGDHWGASKDGVFFKAGGAGGWSQKSIWL